MSAKVVQTAHGNMLIPPHDSYVGRALEENGVYAPDEFQGWGPYLHDGDVVLDIGANLGGHTFAFAKAVGPSGIVIAVEPQRQLFQMLCGSATLIGAKNVWPRWCACAEKPGVAYMPALDYDKANNFGGLPVTNEPNGEPVAQVTVDSWHLSRVDFIKIDVEGMELHVLQGAERTIQASRPVLCVEGEQHAANLLDWMLRANYRPYWQTPSLGAQWPSIRSKNLLCVPVEKDVPVPTGPDIAPLPELDALIGAGV